MTELCLDALWKIKVQECIEASKSSTRLMLSTEASQYDDMEKGMLPPDPQTLPIPYRLLYHTGEGILSPEPQELPMPSRVWLV